MTQQTRGQTLEVIRNQHKALLLQIDQPGEVDLEQVRVLLKTLAQAGTTIENAEDRTLLHELIRYWSSFIDDKTGEFPVVQLQPFDASLIPSKPKRFAMVRQKVLGTTVGRIAVIIIVLLIIAAGVDVAGKTYSVFGSSSRITEFAVPTEQSFPYGIVAGPDRNLWFSEFGSNKIGRITTTGTITEFPLPTSDGGPQGIVKGSDGNLWFTESNGNKIGHITTSGSITEFLVPTPGSYPGGIAAGSDGNLWFTEYSSSKIGRITTIGAITEFPLPTARGNLDGIAAGSDGNLWFARFDSTIGPTGATNAPGGNIIGRITTTGTITEFPLPIPQGYPLQIVAGPDGNLWFTEDSGVTIGPSGTFKVSGGNKIGRITPTGTITEFPIPTHENNPFGIAKGPDGNLWFTEYGSNDPGNMSSPGKIGRITPTGTITEFPISTPGSNPLEIAAGLDGNLWFTEYDGNKIGRITPGM